MDARALLLNVRGRPMTAFPITRAGAARDPSALAAVARDDQVDAFWIGPDGAIGSTFTRVGYDSGRWQPPFAISPSRAARDPSALAAVVRGDQVDVFWIGPDGGIGSTFARAGHDGGRWQQPFPIAPSGAARWGSGLAASVRPEAQVDVFWIGSDGGIGSTSTGPIHEGGRWQTPFPISPPGSARDPSPLAAVVRGDQVDAFWIGPDGAIGSTFTRTGQGSWHPPYPISPPRAARDPSGLAATVRGDRVDVLWIGPDGAIGSTFTRTGQGSWHPPYPISRLAFDTPGLVHKAGPASPLVVGARREILEAFWISDEAGIVSTYSSDDRMSTWWRDAYRFSASRESHARSPMATAVRNDPLDQLDVFWIGPDGAIASDFVNVHQHHI